MRTTHTCGGTILTDGSGEQEHSYCDRCRAFTHDMDDDVPHGTDKAANQRAWDAGKRQSPDAETKLTAEQAAAAAREFVSTVSDGRQWTLSTAEGCLPSGFHLSDTCEDGDFFPVTIANVTAAYLAHASA